MATVPLKTQAFASGGGRSGFSFNEHLVNALACGIDAGDPAGRSQNIDKFTPRPRRRQHQYRRRQALPYLGSCVVDLVIPPASAA